MGAITGLTPTPAQTLQADRLSFPGMLPREILIWKAWLRLHESEYSNYDYNVRVGQGVDPGPGYTDAIRQMAILNSQKRIDAVAWQDVVPTIFEVKFCAGASAVGQLVVYRPLWAQLYPLVPVTHLALVTNSLQADIQPALTQQGISLFVIPTDFSSIVFVPPSGASCSGVDAGSFIQ
jgi:hypothetical protein